MKGYLLIREQWINTSRERGERGREREEKVKKDEERGEYMHL